MTTKLEPQTTPLAISDHPISKEESTFTVQCHDRYFKSVTVTSSSSPSTSGQELFSASSPGMKSWSWRRTVKGTSSESPLFELRHANYLTENNWLVEAPSGRVLAKIKHVSRFAKERSALDVTILNEADAGREVELLVRPQDFGAISTVVTTAVQGVCIGEIKLTGSNDISDLSQADRSTWEVRVAGGVDLALVLVIALCRAEMHHVYRK